MEHLEHLAHTRHHWPTAQYLKVTDGTLGTLPPKNTLNNVGKQVSLA